MENHFSLIILEMDNEVIPHFNDLRKKYTFQLNKAYRERDALDCKSASNIRITIPRITMASSWQKHQA